MDTLVPTEIRTANEKLYWRGLLLCIGSVYGYLSDGRAFACDFQFRSSKKLESIKVHLSVDQRTWCVEWVSKESPLWETILEVTKTGWTKCFGTIRIISPTKKNKKIKTTPQKTSQTSISVKLPSEIYAVCNISLVTQRWQGFVLQRGHIFGVNGDGMHFVTGLYCRKEDKAIFYYFTYDLSKWLYGWETSNGELAKIFLIAKQKRKELGIHKLSYSEISNLESGNYAKQNYRNFTSIPPIAIGGLVRPK